MFSSQSDESIRERARQKPNSTEAIAVIRADEQLKQESLNRRNKLRDSVRSIFGR